MLDSRAASIPVIGEYLRLKYADTNTSICLVRSIVHERVRVYCRRIDDRVFPSGMLASILPITLSSPTTKYCLRRDNSSYSGGPETRVHVEWSAETELSISCGHPSLKSGVND